MPKQTRKWDIETNFNYLCDNFLDNNNFIDQIIGCIKGEKSDLIVKETIKVLQNQKEKNINDIKVKDGREGLRPLMSLE